MENPASCRLNSAAEGPGPKKLMGTYLSKENPASCRLNYAAEGPGPKELMDTNLSKAMRTRV